MRGFLQRVGVYKLLVLEKHDLPAKQRERRLEQRAREVCTWRGGLGPYH